MSDDLTGYVCPLCGPAATATYEEVCAECKSALWLADLPDSPPWFGAQIRTLRADLATKTRALASVRQDLGLSEIAARQARELLASCEMALAERDAEMERRRLASCGLSEAYARNEQERDILRAQLAGPWLVVRAREQYPIEAWQFADDEAQARTFFADVSANWSETFLCRIVAGPGKPQASIPLHPLQAEAVTSRYQCAQLQRELAEVRTQLAESRAEGERLIGGDRNLAVLSAALREARTQLEQAQKRLAECEPVVEAVRRLQNPQSARAHQDALEELQTIPLPKRTP